MFYYKVTMNTVCSHCECFIKGYNVYGTYCPNCGKFIKPEGKPGFVLEYEKKMRKLQIEFLEKLKNKENAKKRKKSKRNRYHN